MGKRFHDARLVDDELVDTDLLVLVERRIHERLRDDVPALFTDKEEKWESTLGAAKGVIVLEDVVGEGPAVASV